MRLVLEFNRLIELIPGNECGLHEYCSQLWPRNSSILLKLQATPFFA
jgi:hypothetical protein